jgi:hypothetical protein
MRVSSWIPTSPHTGAAEVKDEKERSESKFGKSRDDIMVCEVKEIAARF